MRRVLIVAAVIIVLLIAAAAILPALVDVDRLRPGIAARIEQATGRDVALGDLSFRLLPSPRLVVDDVRVAESARYPGRDALRAETVAIRVSATALLRGRLVVRSIVLTRPTLTLIRDARGQWNFQDLKERAAASTPAASRKSADTSGLAVAVDRAIVVEGRVLLYDDAVAPGRRSEAILAPVDAVLHGWGGGRDTEIEMQVGLGRSAIEGRARLTAAPPRRLDLDAGSKGARLADLATLLPWTGVAAPPGMQVAGSVDLQGQARIPIEHPETLRFEGTLGLHDVSYRDAGMTGPLEKVGGSLRIDGRRAEWKEFRATVGGSSLEGTLRLDNFSRPRFEFELRSPRLDLDELLALMKPGGGTAPAAGEPASSSSSGGPGLLDSVTARGRLEVTALRVQTFDLAAVRTAASLERGVLALRDMQASFYGGALEGSAAVDLRAKEPAWTLTVRPRGVDVEPLLVAYDPGLRGQLRGGLSGSLEIVAVGATMDRLLGTARGSAAILIEKGTLASFSVLKQLAVLLEFAGGKGIGREETPFEMLQGSFVIASRRARTEDLELHSADLDLEGRGWVGLDATLDLDVVARFSEDATRGMVARNARLAAFTDRDRLVVYFSLKGPLASPRFSLNTRAQVGGATAGTREKARESLRDRLREKILEQLGAPPAAGDAAPEPAPGATPQASPTPR